MRQLRIFLLRVDSIYTPFANDLLALGGCQDVCACIGQEHGTNMHASSAHEKNALIDIAVCSLQPPVEQVASLDVVLAARKS